MSEVEVDFKHPGACEAEKKDAKLADKNVTQVWKKRIGSEDPFKAALQTEKVPSPPLY